MTQLCMYRTCTNLFYSFISVTSFHFIELKLSNKNNFIPAVKSKLSLLPHDDSNWKLKLITRGTDCITHNLPAGKWEKFMIAVRGLWNCRVMIIFTLIVWRRTDIRRYWLNTQVILAAFRNQLSILKASLHPCQMPKVRLKTSSCYQCTR